jgi:uncharacterized membrane protein YjgN (DUF898 family)
VSVRYLAYMLMGIGASSVVANFMRDDLPSKLALVAAPLAAMSGIAILPLLIPVGYVGGLLIGQMMCAQVAASKAGHAMVLRDSSTGAMRLLLSSMTFASLATLWQPNVQGWYFAANIKRGFWLDKNVDGQLTLSWYVGGQPKPGRE